MHHAIRMPKAPRPRQVVATAEELDAALAVAAPPLRFVLLCAAEMGMRSGAALRFAPCHLDGDIARVPTKPCATTSLPVTKRVAALMASVDTRNRELPYTALLRGGRLLSPSGLHQQWQRARQAAGLRPSLRLHDFRRRLARQVYGVTSDLRVVQALLGHTHLATTAWYLQDGTTRVTHDTLTAAIRQPESEQQK